MRSTGKETVEKERMGFAAHGWVVKRRQGVQWTDGVGKQFKSWKRGKTFHHDLWSPTDRKSTKREKEKKVQSTFLSDWISEDPHQNRKIMIRNALWIEVYWKTSISSFDWVRLDCFKYFPERDRSTFHLWFHSTLDVFQTYKWWY